MANPHTVVDGVEALGSSAVEMSCLATFPSPSSRGLFPQLELELGLGKRHTLDIAYPSPDAGVVDDSPQATAIV